MSQQATSLADTKNLRKSRMFRDYQEAFELATGLPLQLRAACEPDASLNDRPQSNAFCTLMAKGSTTCAACLAMQKELEEHTGMEPRSLRCFAGLCESAVPVRVGDKVIAFLQTGQILLHSPKADEFNKIARLLVEWGSQVDLKQAEDSWFSSRVLSAAQYESMLRLLHIFASHLSDCAHALSLEANATEPESIARARKFIMANSAGNLTLGQVAKSVNISASYFSELFHKATGMTFTDYIARVRVEKVKHLLQNPRLQITTIAYDAGFCSLSQFNRVFKNVTGMAPRAWRAWNAKNGIRKSAQ